MDGGIRILHVEDDAAFSDLTAQYLEAELGNVEIETTTSAEEGLDLLDADAFDCVISDFDLPGMDGLSLLETVRERDETMPFILFTGQGSEEVASDAISAGVTDYLQKGTGTERYEILANQIVNAVEKTRATKRAQRLQARFESLSAAFPDVGFYIDEAGRYVDVLAGEKSQLLYDDPEALLGERFHDILDPEVADTFQETVEAAIAEEAVQTIEYELDVQAGTRWFEGRVAPIDPSIDDEPAVIWVARDITDRKRRENELEQTRERYETILRYVSDYVLIVDGSGDISYASPSVERVMGYSADEIVGESAFSFVYEEDETIATEAFAELIEDPDAEITVEYRSVDADGEPRWIEVRGGNFFDQPLIEGILVTVRDISDRKAPKQELEATKRRLDLALEGADAGIWEWDLETDELYWSDELLDMLGLSPSAFTGDIGFFEDRLHPDDANRVAQTIEEAIAADRTYRTEQRIRHADGHYVWIEVRGLVVDQDDNRTMLGIGIDVTDRKRRERELERHRSLVQAAGDGMYTLDEEGHFTFVNDALTTLSGYEAEELLGESATTLISEEDYERGNQLIRSLLRSDRTSGTFEMDLHTKDGQVIPCSTHVALLMDDGEFRGSAGVARDITDRKRRERQLQRQNERLDEFARVVSHDLRNPLSVATGRLELAMEEVDSEHLEDVEAGLERMEELINDLLTLAQAGEDVSDPELVDLGAFAEECWQHIDAEEATLTVTTDATIVADASRLRSLLENLMHNAVSHGGEDVTVTVGPLPDGFFVEDDGAGIPPANRDRLFESGFTTRDGGTGEGLSIVHNIVTAHGWHIDVTDSTAGGARFELSGVRFANGADTQ